MSEIKEEDMVSVIVPVFNTEKYLSYCIDSILKQSYRNIEVICVDDASTDNSLKLLREYAKSDSRMRVFAQSSNKRQGAARNKGLEEARGEYVLFVDSDDTINPKAIEVLVEIAEKESADAVCFPVRSVINHNEDFPSIENIKYTTTNNPLLYSVTRKGYRIESTPCRLYRRKMLKDVRFIEGISYEDEAFTWETMLCHPRIAILNTSLYNYFSNPASTMHRKFGEDDIRYYCKVIDHLLIRFPDHGKERKCLKRLILPRLLKEQHERIRHLDEKARTDVEELFGCEIRGLMARGMYSCIGIGCRRSRIYKKMSRADTRPWSKDEVEEYLQKTFSLSSIELFKDKSRDIGNFLFRATLSRNRHCLVKYSLKEPGLIWNEYEMTMRFAEVAPENTLKAYGCYQLPNGAAACMIEWSDLRTLTDTLNNQPCDVNWDHIANSIRDVLQKLRRSGIVHRDFWHGNMFVTLDGTIKLFDFQQSTYENRKIDPYANYMSSRKSWMYSYRNIGMPIGYWNDLVLLKWSIVHSGTIHGDSKELMGLLDRFYTDDFFCKMPMIMRVRLFLNWVGLEFKRLFGFALTPASVEKIGKKVQLSRTAILSGDIFRQSVGYTSKGRYNKWIAKMQES